VLGLGIGLALRVLRRTIQPSKNGQGKRHKKNRRRPSCGCPEKMSRGIQVLSDYLYEFLFQAKPSSAIAV
jgi:hypothetical protein